MNNTTGFDQDSITVITITRGRPELLQRAIRSVQAQTFSEIKHVIVIDDCQDTLHMLDSSNPKFSNMVWSLVDRDSSCQRGPARLAYLRNCAIHQVETEFFSFLDDDNEYYPEHLEKLHEFARSETCAAVHSYREILYGDGTPYLEEISPWGRNDQQRRDNYWELVSSGVAVPGSNIWHDKYGITIDTNVWLLKTALFNNIEIPSSYTVEDWLRVIPEDAKLMGLLKEHHIEVKTNALPTVKYYLGGYSNHCGDTVGTETWAK